MAATDNTITQNPRRAGSVAQAALLLPGLAALALAGAAPQTALADSPPEKASLSVRYGDYRDGQAGWDRIRVRSPSVQLQLPVAGEWTLDAALVGDHVSGASPRMHTQQSGASRMSDERKATELKVTRHFARAAVTASVATSDEHDYRSRAAGLQGRWSSDDQNRTWSLGVGLAQDRIDNTYNGVNTAINQHRRTVELQGGVTQVLTPVDIAQATLTRSMGNGYFNDPYKWFDQRPDQRNSWTALLRWNHRLPDLDATVRTQYRHTRDSFGIRSHTLGLEWVQSAGRWTLTPGLRYYTQSAARFYFDPRLDAQGNPDPTATIWYAAALQGDKSADARLAAYGAVTASLRTAYAFTPDTVGDIKLDWYRQDSAWRLGGGGSPGLDALRARFIQVGITHRF